ncbi:MAG: hypothetical protein K6B67_06695 [Lachnospiraceae bacterium]|nr:hypothetical protein [Lachnospiraceae bacterium]
MLKNYFTLINTKYLVIANIIIPVVAGLVCFLGGKYILVVPAFLLAYMVFMVIDGVTDYFCFGNVYQKGSLGMDFLKTSYGGMKALKQAMIVDFISRYVRVLIFVAIGVLPILINADEPKYQEEFMMYGIDITSIKMFALILILLMIFVEYIFINVDRYIATPQNAYLINMLIIVGGGALIGGCSYLFGPLTFGNLIPLVVLMLVLLVVEFIFTIWHMNRKLDASYIDQID